MKKFSIQLTLTVIIGLLIVASAVSVYFAFLREDALPLILVAAANLMAVLSLTFLITRGIMRPLRDMKKRIDEVGQGNLSTRIELKASREMEEVGEAFNDMIWKLHVAREQAKDATKILEHRVEQRTRQLQELMTSLEEKVKTRTKELQENVQELERFQKLGVGRELKMIELKDAIRRLEGRVLDNNKDHARTTARQRKAPEA